MTHRHSKSEGNASDSARVRSGRSLSKRLVLTGQKRSGAWAVGATPPRSQVSRFARCETDDVDEEKDPEPPGDEYQGWLDELAGGPVRVWPLIALWLVIGVAVFGAFDLLGVDSDAPASTAMVILSVVFWVWAVPRWARKKGERQGVRDH